MVGALAVLPAPAAGVVPAIAFGKAADGDVRPRDAAAAATSYRVDRTSMSTKNTKVVPKASVTAVSCRKP